MTNDGDRYERIDLILERVANSQERANKTLEQVNKTLQAMARRQRYHDEAFERRKAEMPIVLEAISANSKNIRTLEKLERGDES